MASVTTEHCCVIQWKISNAVCVQVMEVYRKPEDKTGKKQIPCNETLHDQKCCKHIITEKQESIAVKCDMGKMKATCNSATDITLSVQCVGVLSYFVVPEQNASSKKLEIRLHFE